MRIIQTLLNSLHCTSDKEIVIMGNDSLIMILRLYIKDVINLDLMYLSTFSEGNVVVLLFLSTHPVHGLKEILLQDRFLQIVNCMDPESILVKGI